MNILRFYQMKPEHIERMVMTQLSPKSELTDRKPLNQAIHPFIFQDQRQFPFNKIFRDALHHPSPCNHLSHQVTTTSKANSIKIIASHSSSRRTTSIREIPNPTSSNPGISDSDRKLMKKVQVLAPITTCTQAMKQDSWIRWAQQNQT